MVQLKVIIGLQAKCQRLYLRGHTDVHGSAMIRLSTIFAISGGGGLGRACRAVSGPQSFLNTPVSLPSSA